MNQVQSSELFSGDDRWDAERYRALRNGKTRLMVMGGSGDETFEGEELDDEIDRSTEQSKLDAFMAEYHPGEIANND